MHVTWCSSLLSPPLFKGGIVIASARLSVRPSVCNALSSLTIGRNQTRFGVRYFHMSGVCDGTFFCHPPGAPGRVQRQLSYLKSQFQRFLYQTLCLFSKIKEMDVHYAVWVILQGVALGVAWGSIFFSNMVVWHIKLKGVVSRTGYKLNAHPMVKLVTLRYSQ